MAKKQTTALVVRKTSTIARRRRKKKIAIVGKAPSSWALAPYKDTSWEIWVLNDLPQDVAVPRWDKHFDIHDLDIHRNDERYAEYWKWMQKTNAERPGDMIVRQPAPELPHATIYPLDAIVAEFGNYFTNSISYMIALAIHEGAKEISLYGVDMAQHGNKLGKSEYACQRPSCELLIGEARGRGIKVHIPKECDLLKSRYLYAFEDAGDMAAKLDTRRNELQQRQEHARSCTNEANDRAHQALGAIKMIQELRAATNGEVAPLLDDHAKKQNEILQTASKDKSQAQSQADIFYGALDNLDYTLQWV